MRDRLTPKEHEMILSMRHMVEGTAAEFVRRNPDVIIDREDLISAAYVRLCEITPRWDPRIKYSAYVYWHIRKAIGEEVSLVATGYRSGLRKGHGKVRFCRLSRGAKWRRLAAAKINAESALSDPLHEDAVMRSIDTADAIAALPPEEQRLVRDILIDHASRDIRYKHAIGSNTTYHRRRRTIAHRLAYGGYSGY